MTVFHKPRQSGDRHAGKRRHRFGDGDQAVRYTEAWEHETFAEEQARWERSDPEYAVVCERVRQAKKRGEEASRCAVQAKADWDARVAGKREANDAAQRTHHAVQAEASTGRRLATSRTSSQRRKTRPPKRTRAPWPVSRAGDGRPYMHTTFARESNDSPAPGIMPEPIRVHDEPAMTTTRLGARLRRRGPASGNSVSNKPIKLEMK